ncbi:MAG TPA: hypothetical protein VGF21_02715 [Thermoleophilaceae bacterium]
MKTRDPVRPILPGMELIAAVLIAGPVGYFAPTRRHGLLCYLGVWAVVFPIQTVVVFSASGDGDDVLYWVFNALILALGIGLNECGARLKLRRAAGAVQ